MQEIKEEKRSNQSILRNKSTDKQEELHQTKNLLHGKRKHQQNKKAILKWKKNIFPSHIFYKRLISKIYYSAQ